MYSCIKCGSARIDDKDFLCIMCRKQVNKQNPPQPDQTEGELKPCPFCGRPADYYQRLDDKTWVVRCCGVNCGCAIHGWFVKDQAITAWNTRAKEEE